MGELEEKAAKATRAVIGKLDRQISHFSAILKKGGHPDIVRKINETMVWTAVSRSVMLRLADVAERRSESAQRELTRLHAFIEGRGDPPAQMTTSVGHIEETAVDPASQAQSQLLERARNLLQPVGQVYYFDRAVVLKVWSDHLRVLGKIAATRDLAGLIEAFQALAKTAAEKASGADLFGVILDLLHAARKRQRSAADASELLDYLDQLISTYASWSLLAQSQVLRLESATVPVSEQKITDEAKQRVLETFQELWASVPSN